MENVYKYYKLTDTTKTALKLLPLIVKEVYKNFDLSIYTGFGDNWINSEDELFVSKFGIETDELKIFLNYDRDLSILLKIEKNISEIAYIKIKEIWGLLLIDILGRSYFTYEDLTKQLVEKLFLVETTAEELRNAYSSLPSINNNIKNIEMKIDKLLPKSNDFRRVFLSLRFDEHSKSIAFELEKFFKLLGIEMISGLGVEPRSISEKVIDKFKMDIDMFVILITKTGTSDWINQEIGLAKEKGLNTLIIKNEEFNNFQSGLLNDNEYIQYKANISEAYIGILEAINYMKHL